MRARVTLSLILFILLIPGILLVIILYLSPSSLEELVTNMVAYVVPEAQSQAAYPAIIFGSFVYVIGLTSAIIYLALSDLVNRVYNK